MPRGGGGGGIHSSFHHSSFGGTHSSYHHSSSSSSSSHHSSYSSSHRSSSSSYSKPTYQSSYAAITINNNSHKEEPKKKSSSNLDEDAIASYNYIVNNSKSSSSYNSSYTIKYRYDDNIRKINTLKDKIVKLQTDNSARRNEFSVRFHKILSRFLVGSIAITILFAIISLSIFISSYNKTVTDTFEPLSPDQCIKIDDWYTDNWGTWINDQDTLIEGLEYFYNETGAQPYVYITGEEGVHYSSEELVQGLAEEIYAEKFSDGGHVLLIFREYPDASGDWYADVYSGNAVTSMLGADVSDIVMNNLIKYYDYTSLTDEEMFAKVFTSTADKIHSEYITTDISYNHKCLLYLLITVFGIIFVTTFGILVYLGNQGLYVIGVNDQSIEYHKNRIEDLIKDNKAIEDKIVDSKECPDCGATIKINALGYGKCAYCGHSISSDKS